MEHLRGLDLNLLVLLDALLQASSVSKAAEKARMSTPAMSQALGRLRGILADPLLVRSGRGMVLSQRGEEIKAKVRDLCEEIGSVLRPVAGLELKKLKRTFRIHATDHVLAVAGGAIEALIRQEAPEVVLAFLPNQPDDPECLREGDIDLAIGVYPELLPEIRVRRWLEDRLVCVTRQDHPALREGLSLEVFLGLEHAVVAPRGKPGSFVDSLLALQGLQRKVTRLLPYFTTALAWVAQSDLVVSISERLATRFAEGWNLRIWEPPFPMPSYTLQMIWHPRFDEDPAHRWMRSVWMRVAETLPPLASVSEDSALPTTRIRLETP